MRALMILAALGVCGLASPQAGNDDQNPGTLFPRTYVNPILDRTAKATGDVLTILISETSLASFAANVDAKRDGVNTGWQFLKSFADVLGLGFGKTENSLNTAADTEIKGGGTSTQNGRLQARMTAVVMQVFPNGNMLIEGTRSIQINKELQTFKLTGIVRRDDMREDNTVLSERIAEATIRVDGKGAVSERTKRGILTRILDWLF